MEAKRYRIAVVTTVDHFRHMAHCLNGELERLNGVFHVGNMTYIFVGCNDTADKIMGMEFHDSIVMFPKTTSLSLLDELYSRVQRGRFRLTIL